ncbi:hypothetical protein [Massilia sp. LjRoot122]|uniref:hypothetical protein n=1 Tax=Massilia sp. LjRoot122 TaxID=3342257 RepID=UPI003ECDD7BC
MNKDERKEQDLQSNAGHYTANPAGRGGGIVSSPPEAQVNPPGKPQSGHGSATEPVAGGTAGAMSNQGGAGPMGGAAGGGNPGSQASNADSNLSGSGGQGGSVPDVGAGAGKPPGTPGGNGSKDEPIWGS